MLKDPEWRIPEARSDKCIGDCRFPRDRAIRVARAASAPFDDLVTGNLVAFLAIDVVWFQGGSNRNDGSFG